MLAELRDVQRDNDKLTSDNEEQRTFKKSTKKP